MDGLREHLVSQIHTSERCLELRWVLNHLTNHSWGNIVVNINTWGGVDVPAVLVVLFYATLYLSLLFRCDSLGDDVQWGRAVHYNASTGRSWFIRKGRASVPASNLHHWCLHGHGQVWVLVFCTSLTSGPTHKVNAVIFAWAMIADESDWNTSTSIGWIQIAMTCCSHGLQRMEPYKYFGVFLTFPIFSPWCPFWLLVNLVIQWTVGDM